MRTPGSLCLLSGGYKLCYVRCLRERVHRNPRLQGCHLSTVTVWDITPCSPLNVNRRFGGTYRLHLQDRKNKLSKSFVHAGFLLGLFSTLKMEAICSSETSVDVQRTTRRYIPEDSTLHDHRCENLKSNMETISFQKRIRKWNAFSDLT
jgi:hypothetical protein